METWNLIVRHLIGMEWLNILIRNILKVVGMDVTTKIGQSINFFIYEVIKIMYLLVAIVFVISFIQSYFPPERTKKILSKYTGFKANIVGAMLGIISPFCSCSSIPLFMGLNKAGIPIGATFSFLICSPLVDMASLIFLMSLFGVKIGIAYVLFGVLLAVIGGVIIEKLNVSKEIKIAAKENECSECCCDENSKKGQLVADRIYYAKSETINLVKSIWKYILISIAIGTIIHSWIPKDAILGVLGESNPISVLIATLIGVPLYTDEMSAIVIGQAFFSQGVPIGTVLSFMMSAAALSLPSMIMLKSVLSKKLLTFFIGIVTVGIIMIGYLFNVLSWLF